MSIWISDRTRAAVPGIRNAIPTLRFRLVGAVGGMLIALSGCSDDQAGPGSIRLFAPSNTKSMLVADGRIRITGPKGFCIDRMASRDNAQGAFVLLASCMSLRATAHRSAPAVPVLLTLTVSGSGMPDSIARSLDRLEVFFTTPSGRAALSREGNPADVRILETRVSGGVFYIHARDRGNARLPGAGNEYWRALFDLQGRIVTISVIASAEIPLASETAHAMLSDFVTRLQKENMQRKPERATQPDLDTRINTSGPQVMLAEMHRKSFPPIIRFC